MDELTSIAKKFPTDKWGHHYYTPIYYNYLKELREKFLVVLEIGVGGYDIPKTGGGGLMMWSGFFYNSMIYGIDIYDKSFLHIHNKIRTFKGSQTDEEFLKTVIAKIGAPDIIIDDGSHHNLHVIKSFEILFPLLKEGGFYFVEDCHTSYWDELAVDGTDFGGGPHPNTSMNYFKNLTDSVNYEHCNGRKGWEPIEGIESIHFHKELILIKKSGVHITSS